MLRQQINFTIQLASCMIGFWCMNREGNRYVTQKQNIQMKQLLEVISGLAADASEKPTFLPFSDLI